MAPSAARMTPDEGRAGSAAMASGLAAAGGTAAGGTAAGGTAAGTGGAPGAGPIAEWHQRLRQARRQWVAQACRLVPLTGLPAGQRRARLVTAAAALAVAAVLAVAPLTPRDILLPLQVAAGVAGVVALIAGLLGWQPAIGCSVALLAVDYGATLAGTSGTDPAAPLEAAGLLLVAELAAWSLECRTRAGDGPGVLAWRLRRLALVEVIALVSGTAVLAAAGLPAHGGTSLGAIGVASAVGVLMIAAAVLRRLRRPTAARGTGG
jgi:hypothetical protein